MSQVLCKLYIHLYRATWSCCVRNTVLISMQAQDWNAGITGLCQPLVWITPNHSLLMTLRFQERASGQCKGQKISLCHTRYFILYHCHSTSHWTHENIPEWPIMCPYSNSLSRAVSRAILQHHKVGLFSYLLLYDTFFTSSQIKSYLFIMFYSQYKNTLILFWKIIQFFHLVNWNCKRYFDLMKVHI